MSWLLLFGAILVEVAATLALRASEGFRRRSWIAPVVGGYAVAFGLLALALQAGMAVGVAYGTWAAVGVALTAVLSAVIFGERLTAVMAIGIVLVAVGVFLVEAGSRSVA